MAINEILVINGDSLSPILNHNDEVQLSSNIKKIKKEDIIVFNYLEKNVIKIVKGVPKDTFHISENKLFINDKYICIVSEESVLKDFSQQFEKVLPNDNYIVLGTKENSLDSRIFGPILKKSIIGKVI